MAAKQEAEGVTPGKPRLASEARCFSAESIHGVCYKHAEQLQDELGFGEVGARISSWRAAGGPDGSGAQIDLLYDCDDDIVRLCEIKNNETAYRLTQATAGDLKRKLEVFARHQRSPRTVQLLLITSGQWAPNTWSEDLIDHHMCVEDWLRSSQ